MIKLTLKNYMDNNGLSIQDVTKKTGLSRNTISQLYNNSGKGIQFETLDRLVNSLGISLYEILEEKFYSTKLNWKLDKNKNFYDTGEIEVVFFDESETNFFSLPFSIDFKNDIDYFFYNIYANIDYLDTPESYQISDFLLQFNDYVLETCFSNLAKELIKIYEKDLNDNSDFPLIDFPNNIIFSIHGLYEKQFSCLWTKEQLSNTKQFENILKEKYGYSELNKELLEYGYIDVYGDYHYKQ